jgi:demethylphylloquinol methyltransferase
MPATTSPAVPSETGRRSYSMMAAVYDSLTGAVTGGANLASRLVQVDQMQPGERVLYVGVGSGEDALAAARKGVHVTCLDLSPAMIRKAQQRFACAGQPAEFVCADVMTYSPDEPFDIVVANYFLNVFTRPVMEDVYSRIVALVRPGGRLMIADFARASGGPIYRGLHLAIFYGSMAIHRALGLVGLHTHYDYADYHQRHGLTLQSRQPFRIFGMGPRLFEATTSTVIPAAPVPTAMACAIQQ